MKRHISSVKLSADFIEWHFPSKMPSQRTRAEAAALMEWHFGEARRRSRARAYPPCRGMLHS